MRCLLEQVRAGAVDVEEIAPALFATSDTQELATGFVQRIRAGGSSTFEPLNGVIDLGAGADEVYLGLFGTGIRGNRSLASVTARVGSLDAAVTYAGSQGGFPGLDQVNLRMPRTLAGAGRVGIALTVDGWDVGPVFISFR